jgi:hypothetical protein
LLLDLVTMHEVSNAFVDELFHYWRLTYSERIIPFQVIIWS